MNSRVSPIVACIVTLALVAFGEVCALGSYLARVEASEDATAIASADASAEHGGCEGECGVPEDGENESCPPGASRCCSTWGPPTSRMSLALPALFLPLLDAWEVVVGASAEQERAAEVALLALDRPPGPFSGALFISSIPRRGPPAIS